MTPLSIIFCGSPDWAARCLQAVLQDSSYSVKAVLTQPDRPAGRGQVLTASPVKQLAQSQNIPVFQPETLKDEAIQNQIRNLNPDIIIDIAYGLFFPNAFLEIPHWGCLNIHPSLLPRWRGASPILSAVLAGDAETGVSSMKIDSGLDSGPLLLQKRCPLLPDETTGQLQERLISIAIEVLLESLKKIRDHTEQLIPQDERLASYCKKIQKADAKIDWNKPAAVLYREILAFNPSPISWTEIGGQTIRVWKATVISDSIVKDTPGTIVQFDAEGIDVATGKGILRLLQLQFPGKKVLDCAQLMNSKKDFFLENNRFTISSAS